MQNTISIRVFNFLKKHPPFSFMNENDLDYIASQVIVTYLADGESVFDQGTATLDRFFVIQQGAVDLYRTEGTDKTLVDTCDEGDIFGLRPLIASEHYALSAQAKEEALLYAIPTAVFLPILEKNPKVNFFLSSSFAAGVRNPLASKYKRGRIFREQQTYWQSNKELLEVQTVERSKAAVSCSLHKSVQEAAQIMSEKGVGSIIVVNKEQHPIGIITDKDLRTEIATGKRPLDTKVSAIMSSPVICIAPDATVADVQIAMINKGVHHLCITQDGSDQTMLKGVISEHELLVLQANNPAVLIRELRHSSNTQQMNFIRDKAENLLSKYLDQEVAIPFISNIISKINDAIIKRCIELATAEVTASGAQAPKAGFCWLALGSEGRQEQLLRTDQDNAIVFENTDKANYDTTKAYYLQLATVANRLLDECGFEYCPAQMMASNPKWCMSLAEWQQQFSNWIFKPGGKELMYSTIFFDYRAVYGQEVLAQQLGQRIYEAIEQQEIFLSFLAKNALQNPAPLSFFRNLVVERNGEHKNEFDIKARAMMPLTDAARLLTLATQQTGLNNTSQRFNRLAEIEPKNKALYEQAADAYEILMRFRAIQGLRNKDSGRFFKPSELNKMERLMLRNSFKPIKELQDLIAVRFRLNMLG